MSTLIEELNRLDANKLVFIGCESAWVDIARAGEMRQTVYLDKLSEQEKKKLMRAEVAAEDSLMRLIKYPPRWDGIAHGETLESSVHRYVDVVAARHQMIFRAFNNLRSYQVSIDEFVPFQNRKVKGICPRISDDGICIQLDGKEKGAYWMVEEKYPNGIPELNTKSEKNRAAKK